MTKKGIDVSSWQGNIDWEKVKPNIDFAILRAGYGANHIDAKFERNAKECTRLGIPFGVYWFSYAYNTDMAKAEANYACYAVSKFNIEYPICFDFEYDSTEKAENHGVEVTPNLMRDIAKAFLNQVEANGYYATLYSNPDYLSNGFEPLRQRYDLWLAHWDIPQPKISCGMWQSTSKGRIDGIDSDVDLDVAYKDYPKIIRDKGLNHLDEPKLTQEQELENLKEKEWNIYMQLAEEIVNGKYGNGSARKEAILAKDYDYNFAQSIVNIIAK